MSINIKTIIIVILLAAVAFLGRTAVSLQQQIATQQAMAHKSGFNAQILDFMGLFVEKVLKATGEVSFEDRLQLETKVRELHDPEILAQWNAFVNSQTEREAQDAVRNLLDLLVRKIKGI